MSKSIKEFEINEFNSVVLFENTGESALNLSRLEQEDIKQIKEIVKDYKITVLNLSCKIEEEGFEFLCKNGYDVRHLGLFHGIFRHYEGREVDIIKCFRRIKSLVLHPSCFMNSRIDLSHLTELEEAEINPYWPGAESVFKARSLKKLTIWSYPFKDFSPFRELVNLEHIELNQPSIRNFKGAPGLKKLKEIEIHYAMGLKSLDGIEHFENLESILISASGGPKDLSPIKKLKKIRWLGIDKTPTLKPLEGHESLEAVHIDRVEDRDLSTLFKIPKLKGYVVDRNFENKLPYTEHEINTYVKFYKFKK